MKSDNFHQSDRYCVFNCGDSWFGLPALTIQSVVPRPGITRTPQSDPILRGICHLQNEFIPVISLRALTQIRYEHVESAQQMLVVLGPKGSWGMLIDEAVALADLEISVSTFSRREDTWSKVTVGSASFRNQVLQILDPLAVYQYAINLLDMFWNDQEPELATYLN